MPECWCKNMFGVGLFWDPPLSDSLGSTGTRTLSSGPRDVSFNWPDAPAGWAVSLSDVGRQWCDFPLCTEQATRHVLVWGSLDYSATDVNDPKSLMYLLNQLRSRPGSSFIVWMACGWSGWEDLGLGLTFQMLSYYSNLLAVTVEILFCFLDSKTFAS